MLKRWVDLNLFRTEGGGKYLKYLILNNHSPLTRHFGEQPNGNDHEPN
ncbi:MAG: hypothetical protein ACI81Y_002836 [Glaciecola sp.]|jgi:hypothetical protein